MPTKASKKVDAGEVKLRSTAEKFVSSNKTWSAIQAATASRESFAKAEKDPQAFFASHGAKLPKGLTIEVFAHRPRSMPGPDWIPFILELHSCRTFWVRECDDSSPPKCAFKEQSICFGFRVRPRVPLPKV